MRYGVKDESTLRQMTWEECVRELENCFKLSAGIPFLSLQGDKYGYMPLPRTIKKHDFECYYDKKFDEDTRKIADEWYRFDSNTQKYILRNLKDTGDREYWDNALPILRKGSDMLEFDPELYPGAYVGRSVSEWEVSRVLSDPDRLQKSIWAHRVFQNRDKVFSEEDMKTFSKEYSERDPDTRKKLENLHGDMKEYFSKVENRYIELPISWHDYVDENSENVNKKKYLEEWTNYMRSVFRACIEEIVERSLQWADNAHGLNISGSDAEEMLHHYAWGNNKCQDFVGREDLIEECRKVIAQPNRSGEKRKGDFSGISLAVVGVSGAGKTALMAKLAHLSYSSNEKVPVLLRFCGTSGGSNTGLELMRSTCTQIIFLYKAGNLDFTGECNEDNTKKLSYESIPSDFNEMVQYFHFLLANFVCVLYIDSLDQLANDNMARSNYQCTEQIRNLPIKNENIEPFR
jgi:hypothetical protein